MSSEIAIQIENLGKCYEIYNQPHDRLKQSIFPKLQRLTGKAPQQYYREFWALKDVSFEVNKGETVGIIGRNGSGKSTLLQMICGTLHPTSGTIQTNGRIAALLELGSGFNPEYTGRENVYMNAAVLGLSQKEIDARYDHIAAFADIGPFIEQPVKTYSSGMVVRLAFAVAINADPQILIIDEALSVGDEAFQRKCFARIEEIRNNGATILFCSHSGGTIVSLCDHAILLDAGEKLVMGSPKHIVAKYQKLIYAPADKRPAIRDEIRTSCAAPPEADPSQTETKLPVEPEPEELSDPHLKPQSTVEYESHGSRIRSAAIFTPSGRQVNCLVRGQSYHYTYTVKFEQAATNVRFGMLIKTVSGIEIGGAVSAPGPGQGIPYIAPSTEVKVQFRFTCTLNPGTYFLNAGVTGTPGEEETYLHRVLDICMFRVLPVENNNSTGIVDFTCEAEIDFQQHS